MWLIFQGLWVRRVKLERKVTHRVTNSCVMCQVTFPHEKQKKKQKRFFTTFLCRLIYNIELHEILFKAELEIQRSLPGPEEYNSLPPNKLFYY